MQEAIGYGGEFTADLRISPFVAVNAALGLLETEITDAGPTLAAFEGSPLPRAPEIAVSGGITLTPTDHFNTNINVRHVGDTFSALGQPNLGSYTIVDLSSAYTFHAGDAEFDLNGFVTNLFDKRYETLIETTAAGFTLISVGRPRTFGVALTGKF